MLKRELYLSKIRPFYESDLIKVIVGIRRAGKSTIIGMLMGYIKPACTIESYLDWNSTWLLQL